MPGSDEARSIEPDSPVKTIVLCPGWPLTSSIAARRLPDPLSLVFVTLKMADVVSSF